MGNIQSVESNIVVDRIVVVNDIVLLTCDDDEYKKNRRNLKCTSLKFKNIVKNAQHDVECGNMEHLFFKHKNELDDLKIVEIIGYY
jgi:hypothetical protein